MGTCFPVTILPLFFPPNLMPLHYFSNLAAVVFHGGSCFVSHGCSASTSEMQQLNSNNHTERTVAIEMYRQNLRGVGVPFKQRRKKKKSLCTHKKKNSCSLKEAKSYLNLCGLLKTHEIKTSPRWQKPNGLFTFSWFCFWNSEIKESFVYADPGGLLSGWVFTHQLRVGRWRCSNFPCGGGSMRVAGDQSVCVHFWTLITTLWYRTLRTEYNFIQILQTALIS